MKLQPSTGGAKPARWSERAKLLMAAIIRRLACVLSWRTVQQAHGKRCRAAPAPGVELFLMVSELVEPRSSASPRGGLSIERRPASQALADQPMRSTPSQPSKAVNASPKARLAHGPARVRLSRVRLLSEGRQRLVGWRDDRRA